MQNGIEHLLQCNLCFEQKWAIAQGLKSVRFTLSHQRYQLLLICIAHVSHRIHCMFWYHADWINAWICVIFFSFFVQIFLILVAICWSNSSIVVRSGIFLHRGKVKLHALDRCFLSVELLSIPLIWALLSYPLLWTSHTPTHSPLNFIDLSERHNCDAEWQIIRIVVRCQYCWLAAK